MAIVSRLADRQVGVFEDELAARAPSRVTLTFEDEAFPSSDHGVEQTIVRAVADGRLDLGWVGARALSELGVHDFDALVAPMVLDSIAAEKAVLSTDVPARMLKGLDALGIAGLAVVGGPLRRPIAAGAPLTTLSALEGVPFYSWHGDVNAASIQALGARNVDIAPPARNEGIANGSIRAYENTVGFLADNADWKANVMTANLNLWPSVSVLVANPKSLAALPPEVRKAVVDAAATTSERAFEAIGDEDARVAEACRAGARFAMAEACDLMAIEKALQPVVDGMRRDPLVAGHLDSVDTLTRGIPPESVTIPDGCHSPETGANHDFDTDGCLSTHRRDRHRWAKVAAAALLLALAAGCGDGTQAAPTAAVSTTVASASPQGGAASDSSARTTPLDGTYALTWSVDSSPRHWEGRPTRRQPTTPATTAAQCV